MTIGTWLQINENTLHKAAVGTARLDCMVLLEDAVGKDRSWLLAHSETTLQSTVLRNLDRQIARRARHEPLAYIRGKTEFYGREFYINKRVLEPRPESETMIELALEVIGYRLEVKVKKPRIIDIGTGSGALAVTTKLEIPEAEVIATDIDTECLKVARKNAQNLSADVEFIEGDLLQPIYNLQPVTYNLLLANLPYVPDNFTINDAAMNEPRHAIFGGPDGLDLYRRLFQQITFLLQKPKYVLTESLPFQHKKLSAIAKQADYKLYETNDFIQVFKLIRSG